VAGLKKDGLAIVNLDNAHILNMKNQTKRSDIKFITYGFSEAAEVEAAEVFYNYADEKNLRGILGLSFKLNYRGTTIPVRLNNILAEHSVYAALCAAAAGINFNLNLVEIAGSLSNFSLPPGRMSLIGAIKGGFIIDDTYNASPVSTAAAIKVLGEISAKRKIAALGDMLELGTESEAGHRKIAGSIIESGAQYFFAVGKRMKLAAAELRKTGFAQERIFEFDGPDEAKAKIQKIIEPGDLILVKGSQGMRMEKIVLEIMAEPQRAGELLCRQDEAWKNKTWETA
jgi:UDP-N-acetylmuramoyl-tripeptide--D-alanyl-D-alanine ligase